MKEALITTVVSQKGEQELRIELKQGEDINFYLDNKLIFTGDYIFDIAAIFKRALEIWPTEGEEKEWNNK